MFFEIIRWDFISVGEKIGSNSQKLEKTVETVLIGLFVSNQHHNKL